jgi:hypothetical protein
MSNTGVYDAASWRELKCKTFFIIWELIVSSTLPATLLQPSDDKQEG